QHSGRAEHPSSAAASIPAPARHRRHRSIMSGRKETVLDLAKFVDKGVQVKLTGGRQVTGTLKGYDQLLNLVLDEAIEFEREQDDPLKLSTKTRQLGLIVCRGTAVMLVSPTEGTEEIKNPFQEADGEQTAHS
uniref:Sm domain-containing protein n=5 Tax=Triticinae TaxID=1648030 RepID=A0A453SBN0_AEGTS